MWKIFWAGSLAKNFIPASISTVLILVTSNKRRKKMEEKEEEWSRSFYIGRRFCGPRVYRMATRPEVEVEAKREE
jgi:hypothetical protein